MEALWLNQLFNSVHSDPYHAWYIVATPKGTLKIFTPRYGASSSSSACRVAAVAQLALAVAALVRAAESPV